MRILIAEDEPEVGDLLEALLPQCGRVASTATFVRAFHGRQALEAVEALLSAEKRCFDLICLDIMMPVMNGREALRAIRVAEGKAGFRVGDGAPVVMVTALDDSASILGSFHRDGCNAYVIKPFSGEDLSRSLELAGLPLRQD